MLGHANPSITLKRYTGVLESMRAKTDDALERMFTGASESHPLPDATVVAMPSS